MWRTCSSRPLCRKCSRGLCEEARATCSDQAVSRVRDRRLPGNTERGDLTATSSSLLLWLWETIQLVSHYRGCVCMQALTWWDPERGKRRSLCAEQMNRWHAVMRHCHSLSENKTLSFLCHLLKRSLHPLSVSVLSNQTCWKLHLMLQFRSCAEQSFARLSSGRLCRNRDFTLRRQRSSWIKPHLVGCFLLQDDSKGGWFVSL